MSLDVNKPVQTRDGRKARIIATDKRGCYPIVALLSDGGSEVAVDYAADGRRFPDGHIAHCDLINTPERITREYWVNIYPDYGTAHHDRGKADYYADKSRLACVRIVIDCEKGEGLS